MRLLLRISWDIFIKNLNSFTENLNRSINNIKIWLKAIRPD